ncbi:hypothetical protein [Solitalea canadensis]|uniref:Uncharacterized protein n=1 Tax=Solitalea canadensis (strain ATCC 29591 / DSM 3403 / JCM 21819 / LMG 8368 / NBRC 15130 / NCIMB 12057 / USAM 9D) TaxID=929556 RepID=H8KW69_SOLCM|nr:hypothetical protein [Solitalea canadensis]AFD07090.1 hypothetical protein Solca_2035 [Solitalea canadensis DSM 3403]
MIDINQMKYLLFMLTGVFLTSCYTTRQTKITNYQYNSDINLTIDRVEEGSTISTGSGYYRAGKNEKFVLFT